jgi:2-polyprenyl-3-methyl-5-hydroxy-6-metoxy-1,4-benzoquinol methylase
MAASVSYKFFPVAQCDMCGSKNFKLLGLRLNASQGFRPKSVSGIAVSVKQCRDCGLIFSDPQPIPERLSDHYGVLPEDYWSELYWPPDFFSHEIDTAKRLLAFRPGMTALDVGAGTGEVMKALVRAGFDAWGFEPSEPFYQRAIKEIDPTRLKLATAEEAEFGQQFDFITFGAVLEHLYSPSLALNKAMSWLKPGGIIHAEVPSTRYLISKLANTYMRLRGTNYVTHLSPMHSPYHLYEFSLDSFRNYGLVEHSYQVSTIHRLPKILHPPLKWWMELTGTGMQLSVYLRKFDRSEEHPRLNDSARRIH